MTGSPLPNILYLHSHDTGRYIQPYGYGVPTPHLQRLVEEGVLFRQAFCASPTCSPSRGALLSGMAPHNNGMMGLAHLGFRMNDYTQHIIHTLGGAGYTSILAGVQHLDHPDGRKIGYDRILADEPAFARLPIQRRAAAFLNRAPKQPFFLDVGFHDTHRPFPEPEVEAGYIRPPAPLPDTPETRRDMAGFITSAQLLDRQMGAVLRALEKSGLAENTLVICTTDHGLAFPAMKCNLTDHGTGVMLLVRGPGGFTGGKVIDALVSHIDLFPTLCDLLNVTPPPWLQGCSLLPLVDGRAEEIHEAVFAEINFHVAVELLRSVRTRRWKYIRRFDSRVHPVLPNCDDSLTKTLWMENGWRNRPVDAEELYDLLFDPNEAHNLARDPGYQATLSAMRERLEGWMRDTDDPLLRGPLQWPEGTRRLEPDQISPSELKLEE